MADYWGDGLAGLTTEQGINEMDGSMGGLMDGERELTEWLIAGMMTWLVWQLTEGLTRGIA